MGEKRKTNFKVINFNSLEKKKKYVKFVNYGFI